MILHPPNKAKKPKDSLSPPPAKPNEQLEGVVLITARWAVDEIKKTFETSLPMMSFDEWFTMKNLERYAQLRDSVFEDECSKEVLSALLMAILSGEKKYYETIYNDNAYFCLARFNDDRGECFLDAGAFVGDTVERFIWSHSGGFGTIYAFEPFPEQFLALERRTNRLRGEWALSSEKIRLVNAAIAEKSGEFEIAVNKSDVLSAYSLLNASSDLSGDSVKYKIPLYSVDDYFKTAKLTMLKADVEGMEMSMLRGARETILRDKPKMALCVYHSCDDLFSFIEFIKGLDLGYKFALRHHSIAVVETVLYCWVE